ncbi:MAG: alpha/beta fold hydrolase [Thermaurantiacus sp.]
MAEADLADPHLTAPLAALAGRSPPAPDWFTSAIAAQHERGVVSVAGADIAYLAWGERGRPGLLLLHGNGAHADWWRFIAPFFAATHRVAALSWSGMGESDHRSRYAIDLFVAEAIAVATAAGLGSRFTAVGHSFGGFPLMALANREAAPLARAIILDTPFDPTQRRRPRRSNEAPRPHRVYPTIEAALARFRWAPAQPCPNLYITDFVARHSLKPVQGGWTWRFDPFLWSEFEAQDGRDLLVAPRCPVALMWGERSTLMPEPLVADMVRRLPSGTVLVPVPDAGHHVMADQPLALVSALRALLAVDATVTGRS